MKVSDIRFKSGSAPALPEGDVELSRRQAWAIERAVNQCWEYDTHGNAVGHEYKEFRIAPLGTSGIVVVYLHTGMKGDEGTAASIFCRYRRQIFVGKRGGITAYGKHGKKLKNFKALIYGVDR